MKVSSEMKHAREEYVPKHAAAPVIENIDVDTIDLDLLIEGSDLEAKLLEADLPSADLTRLLVRRFEADDSADALTRLSDMSDAVVVRMRQASSLFQLRGAAEKFFNKKLPEDLNLEFINATAETLEDMSLFFGIVAKKIRGDI